MRAFAGPKYDTTRVVLHESTNTKRRPLGAIEDADEAGKAALHHHQSAESSVESIRTFGWSPSPLLLLLLLPHVLHLFSLSVWDPPVCLPLLAHLPDQHEEDKQQQRNPPPPMGKQTLPQTRTDFAIEEIQVREGPPKMADGTGLGPWGITIINVRLAY